MSKKKYSVTDEFFTEDGIQYREAREYYGELLYKRIRKAKNIEISGLGFWNLLGYKNDHSLSEDNCKRKSLPTNKCIANQINRIEKCFVDGKFPKGLNACFAVERQFVSQQTEKSINITTRLVKPYWDGELFELNEVMESYNPEIVIFVDKDTKEYKVGYKRNVVLERKELLEGFTKDEIEILDAVGSLLLEKKDSFPKPEMWNSSIGDYYIFSLFLRNIVDKLNDGEIYKQDYSKIIDKLSEIGKKFVLLKETQRYKESGTLVVVNGTMRTGGEVFKGSDQVTLSVHESVMQSSYYGYDKSGVGEK